MANHREITFRIPKLKIINLSFFNLAHYRQTLTASVITIQNRTPSSTEHQQPSPFLPWYVLVPYLSQVSAIHLKNRAPANFNYRCPIFKWVAETWLHEKTRGQYIWCRWWSYIPSPPPACHVPEIWVIDFPISLDFFNVYNMKSSSRTLVTLYSHNRQHGGCGWPGARISATVLMT